MGIKLTSGTRGKLNIVPLIMLCGSASGVAFHKGVPEEAYARCYEEQVMMRNGKWLNRAM